MLCPDELQRERNESPQWQLPYTGTDLAAAHAEVAQACPHRRTYVVAGRVFCNACGRKVGQEAEDTQ